MAICRHSRRQVYRLLTVKSALLGVPMIWILFILWTVYYTMTLETAQSRKQLYISEETRVLPESFLQHTKETATGNIDNNINQTVIKDIVKPLQSSIPEDKNYFEFFWKGDKPKPEKKYIVPNKRFDPPKLGEGGKAVKIVPEELNTNQRAKYDDGWKKHKFNEYASLQISTQRELEDFRPEGCKKESETSHLEEVSIIICFYNEAWSVLLRSIHSILTRSPPELIKEIILVDDKSDVAMLGEPLEYYVTQVDKLRLLRMTKRSGLVRARLAGVNEAKGPILLFLDSHIECEEGWLPPLLQTLADHPNFAVTPEIDVIDHKDFSVAPAIDNIGILQFESMQFDWTNIMPRIKNSRKSPSDPIKSPTMAGGLFAIRKDYFLSIGTYDPALEVWGGENIEISLKLWMCGGGIFIHPCSRVAHIFRDESPYIQDMKSNLIAKNSARVAQVWTDEYRGMYFRDEPYDEEKYGSVQERIELRKRLKCESFSWYVENIYPELFIEGTGRFRGKIKSATGLCIHIENVSNKLIQPILKNCKKVVTFESSKINEIRVINKCLKAHAMSSDLLITKCDHQNTSQSFIYTQEKTIHHLQSNNCLTASSSEAVLSLEPCNGGRLQTWFWPTNDNYFQFNKT